MSSFIVHLLIPTLAILAIGIFRPRDAWVWSWAAWAGDIDYATWMTHVSYGWPNLHRALFHNVFWLLYAIGVAAWAFRRWKVKFPDVGLLQFSRAKPGWVLVPYFYATHLILDTFQGGLLPFWPFSSKAVYWAFSINVDTTKPVPAPEVESDPGTYVGVPDVSEVYPWMTGEEFAFFLLYLLSLLVLFLHERYAVMGNAFASRLRRAAAELPARPPPRPEPDTKDPASGDLRRGPHARGKT